MNHTLTLRQLSVFVAVAETGSTTGAAHHLAMSQSAVSSALSELENALCEQLFDRRGKKLFLNDFGRLILPRVRALFDQVDSIVNAGRDANVMLRVAASTTISNYLLPPLLARYHRNQTAGGKVTLLVGNTHDVLDAVRTFNADVGLIEGSCTVDEFVVEHWMDDELLIVTSPGHQLASPGAATREALRGADWLVREHDSGTREVLDAQIAGVLGPLHIALELANSEAIRRTVMAGYGICCLSTHVVGADVKTGALVNIGEVLPPLRRPFSIVLHKDKLPTRGLNTFLSYLRAVPEAGKRENEAEAYTERGLDI
ncbi:LysR family transcriptional regulator [Desulfovibrio sp. OttesenSCG-928-O18]|nr:LysR family transcriptional regulator [Desulfovibrio sp. OttesenSCG-928-O18]